MIGLVINRLLRTAADARRLDSIAGITVVAGVSADASAASWDLAIAVHAESLEMLGDAMRTSTWSQFFDGHLGSRAAVIKAWNFATAVAPSRVTG